MKVNKFMAAALCAVTLLTGCGTTPVESNSQSSSSETSSYFEESSSYESQTSSTTTSSTRSSSTTSSTVSTPPKKEPKIPKATLNQDAITVNTEGKYMNVPFTTDISFDPKVQYYLRIYFADSAYSGDELRYDEPFDTSLTSLNLKLHNGGNYYNIQFYSDEKEGEHSNQVFHIFTPPVKHKTFEFYTMASGFWGDGFETLFGYPDYDEVDRYLAQGITPTYISVDVYYRCLRCDTETFCGTYKFSYSKGEAKLVSYHCDNKRCSNHSGSSTFLNSRIVG